MRSRASYEQRRIAYPREGRRGQPEEGFRPALPRRRCGENKRVRAETDYAGRLGDALRPRDFTGFFAENPPPQIRVPLRKYTLPIEMEKTYRQAITRANKGKEAGLDGVPMELPQKFPPAFAEILFELFAAGSRMGCVMKDWDLSIPISIFKKKGLLALPANRRPLRLILITRKIFEMKKM